MTAPTDLNDTGPAASCCGPPPDPAAMAAYERQYGVLAEGALRGWQEADGAAEITRQEFESTWAAARETLDADRTEETT
ncbi:MULTISPECIES: hypothetical protein [unclassified Streptomyces]|uniref:hypothetical protein n=1 Tax=unclassified Streptomyces TaxID=2593676 RepID=UPI003D743C92